MKTRLKSIFGPCLGICLISFMQPDGLSADGGELTFSIIATVMVRSPEPMKLAEYYAALGFEKERVAGSQGVVFHLENHQGSLEIIQMDPDTKPSGPKRSRTQQGVVAIFETDNLDEVLDRARALGSPLIETWTHPRASVSIHYIADPENNILGFTSRGHNPNLNTPTRSDGESS